jgi:hypothetical protein
MTITARAPTTCARFIIAADYPTGRGARRRDPRDRPNVAVVAGAAPRYQSGMHPGYPPPPPGYGDPPGYGYPPAGPIKSSTPRTLGTLSMVFGGLVAAMSLFGALAGKTFGTMMDTNRISKAAFERYLAEIHTATMTMSLLMAALSIALIYIGTGQRSYQRWAVRASIWWGIAALVFLVVQLIVQVAVVLPAIDRLMADIGNRQFRETMGMAMKVGIFGGMVFYAPYPILLIASFRKPANVEAMDQPPLPTAEIHRA